MMENATRALADAPAAQRGAGLPAPDTVASAASGARGN
jgi:hypothetical protein